MKEATNIKVRENITFAQFGCQENYFEMHIRDKVLKVTDQVKGKFLIIEDAEGESWSIFKGDYVVLNQLELYTTDDHQGTGNERVNDFQLKDCACEEIKRKAWQ